MRVLGRFQPAALLSVLLVCTPCLAAGSPDAPTEIDQLTTLLGRSGCEFQRNGRWHDAASAEQHLRRKYEWLRKRDLVGTTEQFIERAGTRSSMTGRPYQVRCAGSAPVEAAVWLREQLRVLRRRGGNAR